MIALISPDLAMLADLEYANISVEVEHDGEIKRIRASPRESAVALEFSGVGEPFVFSKYVPDPDEPTYRQADSEVEYYRDIASQKASHPVLRAISSLPTPMFLGIDRRSSLGIGRSILSRQARFGRNIFSKSLAGSLAAAANMAETRYRDALIQSGRVGERLQREMLLGLLGSEANEFALQNTLRLPTHEDVSEMQRVRRDIKSIADIMRVPVIEVQKRLIPLLDLLQSLANEIPAETDLQRAFSSDGDNSAVISAVASWNANQPHLLRVKFISEKVARYNTLRENIMSPTETYRELVNKFLFDSGKVIKFGEDGQIGVEIDGVVGPRSISSLSSGEAQIFVILTHLSFNPAAQKNNVFIIDEPELSLHVQWQEMFVESVQAANPNIQYILATHSPSIILEKTSSCIDISRKTKLVRKSGGRRG